MKKYITLAALLAAGTAIANADTTVTFSAANNAQETSGTGLAWNYNSTDGYYVGATLSDTLFSGLTWGALSVGTSESAASTSGSMIMNQNQTPLFLGTIVPYGTSQPKYWALTFSLVAGDTAVKISSLTFDFVGAYNGGSFDNAYNNAGAGYPAQSTGSVITLSDAATSTLATTTQDILATSKSMVEGTVALPEANSVTLNIAPVTVEAGESVSFTLSVTQETINAGLKSIGISAVAVPEPSAFGLLAGLGALALVASRRRRNRR